MSKRVTLTNTLSRAKRELQMVNRIIILVSIELTLGIPYTIFLLMGFISQPPKYPIRIAYTFVDVSLLLIMIALSQFTDPVKTIVMKKLNRQPHTDAVAVL
ncbi:unnamed protein product [Adineta steineri]|uniref:G-protein coupled receptors family 1 profile domain-containing protein n=1 Tax=Adineta steineri TaxID=433720 RepID=A0A814FVU0_9BILA|nr:unnamed protein product [Adineta steineri]CAF4252892.1 unnamed protein product [Adineta steineri]